MEELYRAIEEAIRKSGYPAEVDGEEFYAMVSEEADEKENGKYMFLIKVNELVSYQGCMDIMDDAFDLHFVDIHVGDRCYHADFDA